MIVIDGVYIITVVCTLLLKSVHVCPSLYYLCVDICDFECIHVL